jgi:hypothetical protein
MENLKKLTHLLILILLFLSKPSWSATHSGHGHKDYTDCLYETGTGNLNVDQVLCLEKGCECYTKVFKNQIDGLKDDRIEMIQDKMVDVHSQVVSKIISELTDMNTIFEKSGNSLLGAGSTIQSACSFDSLKKNLSCKSPLAKEIAKNIKEVFLDKSDYNYGEKNNGEAETPYQCLSKGEVRGVTLHKERSKHMTTIFDRLTNISDELKEKLLNAENPLDLFNEMGTRKDRRLLNSVKSLPIIRNLFQSKEGVAALFQDIRNKNLTKENFFNRLTSSGTIQSALNSSITNKCHQVFKTIDSLACQKIAHPFISNKGFNLNAFGYRDSEPESDLETHLFACQGEVCLKEGTCTSKETDKLDSNDLLSSILGKETFSNIYSKQVADDSSKLVNRRVCALLVCGDESHGESLFTKQVNSMKGTCSPQLNPKRTPMEAYSLLKCPDSDICNMPEMEDFKAYLEYFKSNMVVETQTMMVPVEGIKLGTEGSEVEKTITTVSKKKSPFLQNFIGEVGQDLDAFFDPPETKSQLAKKEESLNSNKSETIAVIIPGKSQGKTFETPKVAQGWSQYGNQNQVPANTTGTAFSATQIGTVSVNTDPEYTAREKQFSKTAEDAVKTAKDSMNQVSELQKELQNAKDANKGFGDNGQVFQGNQQREIASVSVASGFVDEGTEEGFDNSANDQSNSGAGYTAAPYSPEDIPTERTQASSLGLPTTKVNSNGKTGKTNTASAAASIPAFEIARKNLTELNAALVEEFKIIPEDAFVIKVSVGKGKQKKMIPVMVENVPYKGKLILRPIKEAHNKEIFAEVLASPLFENYRTILAIREERKKFFNEILPTIKRI